MQRTINSCSISKPAAPELLIQGQDGSMTLVQPNLYRTTFENGQPVMVTLNPYSTQLVDNLNKMMGNEIMGSDVNRATQGPAENPAMLTYMKTVCNSRTETHVSFSKMKTFQMHLAVLTPQRLFF